MNLFRIIFWIVATWYGIAQAAEPLPVADPKPSRVLWMDALGNDGGEFGWDVTGLRPTREALGLRLNLTGEPGIAPTMSRYIPLRLADVRDGVIYSQFLVTEVGGDKMTMWNPGGGYNPGHHPGLWTVPFKLKPAATSEYYRINFYGTGYVTLRFVRLVTGETPLPGSALWQRDGVAEWSRPARKGDSLRVVANLGSRTVPPTVTFVGSSFNFYQPVDLTGNSIYTSLPMNDSGQDGDAVAGDGLWTAMLVFNGKKSQKAGVVTAVVRFGAGESDATYVKAPWPFETDAITP
jgi:hypothetical protein